MIHRSTIKHVGLKHKHVAFKHIHIFKNKNPDRNIILIAIKSGKMFQTWKCTQLKIKPIENLSPKNIFRGNFSLISLIIKIPWLFSKKESIFKFPENPLLSLISRLTMNPVNAEIIWRDLRLRQYNSIWNVIVRQIMDESSEKKVQA